MTRLWNGRMDAQAVENKLRSWAKDAPAHIVAAYLIGS